MDSHVKDFIRNKVEELGSLSAVQSLYNQDCAVDNYANSYARRIYKNVKQDPDKEGQDSR